MANRNVCTRIILSDATAAVFMHAQLCLRGLVQAEHCARLQLCKCSVQCPRPKARGTTHSPLVCMLHPQKFCPYASASRIAGGACTSTTHLLPVGGGLPAILCIAQTGACLVPQDAAHVAGLQLGGKVQVRARACVRACKHVCMYVHARACVRACVHVCMHACMCTMRHACVSSCARELAVA